MIALAEMTTSIIMVIAKMNPLLVGGPDVEDEVRTSITFIIQSIVVRRYRKVSLDPGISFRFASCLVIAGSNAQALSLLDGLAVTSHLIISPLGGSVLKDDSVWDLNIRSR